MLTNKEASSMKSTKKKTKTHTHALKEDSHEILKQKR